MARSRRCANGRLLKALPALVQAGCLPERDAAELTTAYRFLRLAENRIQALYDQQTHDLPADPADQQRLASRHGLRRLAGLPRRAPGAAGPRGPATFATSSFAGRTASGDGDDAGERAGDQRPAGRPRRSWPACGWTTRHRNCSCSAWQAPGSRHPAEVLERVRRLREGGLQQRLDQPGRQRLDALVPAVLRVASRQAEAARALDGMVLVLEAIGRRSAYFALLNENPAALQRLVGICAASEFLARLVATHPLLLDELLDPRVFEQAPSRSELAADLDVRLVPRRRPTTPRRASTRSATSSRRRSSVLPWWISRVSCR